MNATFRPAGEDAQEKQEQPPNDLPLHPFARYQRQLTHPGFGVSSQEKLKNSTVMIAGIGGLGGPVAHYLAAAGVARLILVHAGELELPDLNRQTLLKDEWVGKPRAKHAAKTLSEFNPEVEVITFDEWITKDNYLKFFDKVAGSAKTDSQKVDLVIDARHNFPERKLLTRGALETGVPIIEAAMNGMEGYLFSTLPGSTACLECLYPDDPPWDPFGFSVFGAVSGVIGSFAALEAIKILTSYEANLFGTMQYIDFTTFETRRYKLRKRSDCKICSGTREPQGESDD